MVVLACDRSCWGKTLMDWLSHLYRFSYYFFNQLIFGFMVILEDIHQLGRKRTMLLNLASSELWVKLNQWENVRHSLLQKKEVLPWLTFSENKNIWSIQFRRVCLLHLYLRPTAAGPATFRSPWQSRPHCPVIDVGVAWVIRQLLTHPTRIILLHVCLASVLCSLEDINSLRWRTQIKFKKFSPRLRG